MKKRGLIPAMFVAAIVLTLQACTSAPSGKSEPRLETPAQAELATNLDPVIAEAARGYERRIDNGELLFCKREQSVGSKLWTTTCFTEEQLRAQVENAKVFRGKTLEQGRRCAGGPACQSR